MDGKQLDGNRVQCDTRRREHRPRHAAIPGRGQRDHAHHQRAGHPRLDHGGVPALHGQVLRARDRDPHVRTGTDRGGRKDICRAHGLPDQRHLLCRERPDGERAQRWFGNERMDRRKRRRGRGCVALGRGPRVRHPVLERCRGGFHRGRQLRELGKYRAEREHGRELRGLRLRQQVERPQLRQHPVHLLRGVRRDAQRCTERGERECHRNADRLACSTDGHGPPRRHGLRDHGHCDPVRVRRHVRVQP